MTNNQINKAELAGWSFIFCTFLYEKHKIEPKTINWPNIEKKYFENGQDPIVSAKSYLKSIINTKINNMQIGERGIKGLGLGLYD